MRAFPEYDVDSLMYPALETPDQPPDDDRYAFMDADHPERAISEHGGDGLSDAKCQGRAAFAQDAVRPDRHVAIKLPVRGLIPILEIIPFRGHWLVVMPRWGEDIMLPFPTVAGPVYDLIEDLLEGLAFLHSHNIVHRDHSSKNLVVNHVPILTYDDIRNVPPTRHALGHAGALRHAIFDFDVALVFPDRASARLPWMEFWRGAAKGTHDVRQGEYEFDPFAADMCILGLYLDDSLRSHIPYMPILAPSIDGLLHWHVPSRLTAAQALALLRSLRAENSSLDRQRLPAERSVPDPTNDLWRGLSTDFLAKWGHLRIPPEPRTRRILRRLCHNRFMAWSVRSMRRVVSFKPLGSRSDTTSPGHTIPL
ncbi:unnamed protein product [Mycena citricolor]|uniref:Uncharacterized protein n=1 Tax=Mycena citricolor TaxID=2018698 RepID=A0AAD2JXN1_9AGAR|nr:unnamed protein product [Mycena citricolor]